MSIMEFVALVSFGLTCFSIGYTLGKDAKKNNRPVLRKRAVIFVTVNNS